MARWFRALSALAEDPVWFLALTQELKAPVTPVPGAPMLSFDLGGHQAHTWSTCTHASKTHMHKINNAIFKLAYMLNIKAM
jgi:hypothetical protein